MDCLSKFYLYELLFLRFDFTSVFDCLMHILDILHGVNFVYNVVSAKEAPLICEAYLVMWTPLVILMLVKCNYVNLGIRYADLWWSYAMCALCYICLRFLWTIALETCWFYEHWGLEMQQILFGKLYSSNVTVQIGLTIGFASRQIIHFLDGHLVCGIVPPHKVVSGCYLACIFFCKIFWFLSVHMCIQVLKIKLMRRLME